MKSLTIRLRVTLWYAFFMLLLIVFSLALISDLARKAMMTNQRGNLIETVHDGIAEIYSPENFDYFDNGIYLQVYDDSERYVAGIIPDEFPASLKLLNDSSRTIESNGQVFYVYDKSYEKAGNVYWMRGVVPESAPDLRGDLFVRFASGFLPLFVLLTCLIGYFITKRAFRPVRKIQETAQSIADGNDLSLRIALPEGKDEIAMLGKTVDHMLDKLQRSLEKEKQFSSDVSHELRTPLAVIMTESEYALQYASDFDELKESMEVVNRQADRMSVMINQLLFFLRSDHDSLSLGAESPPRMRSAEDAEQFAVLPVVSELVQDYNMMAETKNISISFAGGADADLSIRADQTMFIRCLSNLIQNAINYGNEGGHIEVGISQAGQYLVVTVSDDGIGISEENQAKIWDRFYQVEESRSQTNGGSMGLGLSMVKTIAEKHGGYVTVESTPGKGSTFNVYFLL